MTLMLGKIEGRRRRGVTEDETAGWRHQLNGHDFQQTPGDSETGKTGVLQSMKLQKLDMTE